jgi:hypothetical protein
MSNRPGRPRLGSGKAKDEYLEMRLTAAEKRTFQDAADLAGVGLATWARERLRRIARRELEEAEKPIAFLDAEREKPQ